jgi:hypothetical protein
MPPTLAVRTTNLPCGRRHTSDVQGATSSPFGLSGFPRFCSFKQFGYFAVERGQVVRFAAGDEVAIHYNFLVHPVCIGVPKVGLQ